MNKPTIYPLQIEVKKLLDDTLDFSEHHLSLILGDNNNAFRLQKLKNIVCKIKEKLHNGKLHLFCFSVKTKDDFNLYELLKEDELNEHKILDLVDVIINRALEYHSIKKLNAEKLQLSTVQYV